MDKNADRLGDAAAEATAVDEAQTRPEDEEDDPEAS
jgi:hypothetical protein